MRQKTTYTVIVHRTTCDANKSAVPKAKWHVRTERTHSIQISLTQITCSLTEADQACNWSWYSKVPVSILEHARLRSS